MKKIISRQVDEINIMSRQPELCVHSHVTVRSVVPCVHTWRLLNWLENREKRTENKQTETEENNKAPDQERNHRGTDWDGRNDRTGDKEIKCARGGGGGVGWEASSQETAHYSDLTTTEPAEHKQLQRGKVLSHPRLTAFNLPTRSCGGTGSRFKYTAEEFLHIHILFCCIVFSSNTLQVICSWRFNNSEGKCWTAWFPLLQH